ncbi:MAG TPA: ATP-binding protein [Thermoanaerobaculia bacterium]|nr:ATP-binding protein [Thermoanaerobaculia bacterium]
MRSLIHARRGGTAGSGRSVLRALAALVVIRLATVVLAESPSRTHRVVILSGTDLMLPASLVEDGIIRTTLARAIEGPIEFYSEGLDAFRFRSEEYEPQLVSFFQDKYRGREPDVVIALSEPALTFLMNHRSRLWAGSSVVFSSVRREFFDNQSPPAWATGVYEYADVAGTIELAGRLQPRASRIVVVAGMSERDDVLLAEVTSGLASLGSRYQVTVRKGVPASRFRQEFGGLPSDVIVLYLSMFLDAEGHTSVPLDLAQALASASSAPVYGLYSTYLGTGIIGGSLHDYEAEGRAVAALAIRVLHGESPASISPLPQAPPLRVVDSRVLSRFHIAESRVPAEAELKFRTPSFWELYRWRVVAVGVLFILETALLVALFAERHGRRLAEDENRVARRELAHAGRMATVGELAASISHEINQPLGAILANAEAAEILFEAKNGHAEEVRQILSDIRRDDLRASEIVRRVRRLAGRREMEMRPVDLKEVVETVLGLLRYETRRRGVAVVKDFEPDLPRARGDEVSLQQVLINLAMNAMEAMGETPEDLRRLVIRMRARGSRLAIGVVDVGRGIPAENHPKLFESFFTTKGEGVGLGLSICRSIVEAHGGDIRAENNAGVGATFEFVIPVYGVEDLPAPRDRASEATA